MVCKNTSLIFLAPLCIVSNFYKELIDTYLSVKQNAILTGISLKWLVGEVSTI